MASRAGRGARVLIYSHDTFGLGHLRRCRTIAHSLVESHEDLSVLILSGSPIIGSFDFRRRVDFVRVPGVIKLRNGEYTSLNLQLQLEETLSMRSSIIEHTADIFDPDVFIVDKEPLGLRGEIRGTLEMLRARGKRLVLGLRDVLDDPDTLFIEWERKNALPALQEFYDEVWVYGLPQICEPLGGLPLTGDMQRKISYTGYLPITVPKTAFPAAVPEITSRPFLLVTTGGGGDGDVLIEWVLRAYESEKMLPYPALLVLGPFLQPEKQSQFMARAAKLDRVEAIVFNPRIERLEENAMGIVAMGGVQHLLRDPVARQAGGHRSTDDSASGTADPSVPGARTRPRAHARGRRSYGSGGDGPGTAGSAAPTEAFGNDRPRFAGRSHQREPVDQALARSTADT